MAFVGCSVSLSTMTAITLDRFLLHYHLQYPNLMKTSRETHSLITIWCRNTLFSFSILFREEMFIISIQFFGSQFAFQFESVEMPLRHHYILYNNSYFRLEHFLPFLDKIEALLFSKLQFGAREDASNIKMD